MPEREITIGAQDAKPLWEIMLDEPLLYGAGTPPNGATMGYPSAVDMIDL
jgi:hypothetical protein